MNNNKHAELISMARKAGATPYTNRHYPDVPYNTFSIEQLERFAELVKAGAPTVSAAVPSGDRDEFEAAFKERAGNNTPGAFDLDDWGNYKNSHMQCRWEGWLDSRKSQPVSAAVPEDAGWFKYDKVSQCYHPQYADLAERFAQEQKWVKLYTAPQPPAPAKPLLTDEHTKDTQRLEFVLWNSAFSMHTESDAGSMCYQLLAQDEDENYIVLSGDNAFFPTERAAIDAAIVAAHGITK